MIVVLGAVAAEQQLLRRALAQAHHSRHAHLDCYSGGINGHELVVCAGGVGKGAAAAATALLIDHFAPNLVLVCGCAGAYPRGGLQIGDMAVATEEILGDDGVQTAAEFLNLADIGLPGAHRDGVNYYNRYPLDSAVRALFAPPLEQFARTEAVTCASGSFVTLSTCCGSVASTQQMYQRWNAVVENMEGAACAQICALNKVPMWQLRAISNMVEQRDTSRWQLRPAMERAQRAVIHLLHHISPEEINATCTL